MTGDALAGVADDIGDGVAGFADGAGDAVAGFTVGGVAVSAAVLFGTGLDAAGAASTAGALLGDGSTAAGNCDVDAAGATGSALVRFDIQSHPAAMTTMTMPAITDAVLGAGR